MDLWWRFIWQNGWFATNMFGALVFLAVAWLYLDAYLARRVWKQVPRLLGFIGLAISFAAGAAVMEPYSAGGGMPGLLVVVGWVRLLSYLLIIWGLVMEPIQPRPQYAGWWFPVSIPWRTWVGPLAYIWLAIPSVTAVVGLLYWRRATVGLERHVKPLAYAFFGLAAADLLQLSRGFWHTSQPWIYQFVAPYGYLYGVRLVILAVSLVMAFAWVWRYLLMRLITQLMMVFTTAIFAIFVVTALVFTGLLMASMEQVTLQRLTGEAGLVEQVVERYRSGALADARSLAVDPTVVASMHEGTSLDLMAVTEDRLQASLGGSAVVVDGQGKVIARGERSDDVGTSVSADVLYQRVAAGEELSSVRVLEEGVGKQLWVMGGAPIARGEDVAGVVLWGNQVNHGLLADIAREAGVVVTVWAGEEMVLTTAEDSAVVVGMDAGEVVGLRVLGELQVWSGRRRLGSVDYLAAYAPVYDHDAVPVGMVSVGVPQAQVFALAAEAMRVTFGVTIGLILLSLVPTYFVARQLSYQLS